MKHFRIRPNHSTRTPGAIVTVDTESIETPCAVDPDTHVLPLRLGVARYCRIEGAKPTRREVFRFTSTDAFWQWLRSKMDERRVLWLWCHNLGWDLTVLRFWSELESGRFVLRGPPRKVRDRESGQWKTIITPGLLLSKDPPSAFCVWDKLMRKLRGCDTFNWYPHSLAKLGDMLGVQKLEMPRPTDTDPVWFNYCERDCEITEALVLELFRFVRTHDLGNLRYTPAAQSMSIFRHLEMPSPIDAHDSDPQAAFERRSYYGGRKAVFFCGEVRGPHFFQLENSGRPETMHAVEYTGPVHAYDVVAAYPSVMRDNYFPTRYTRTLHQIEPATLTDLLKANAAVALVRVSSDVESYPLRDDQCVRWCSGTFDTVLCGPELVRACQSRHVRRVYCVSLYERGKPFGPFVDKLTELESLYPRETDPIRREMVKLLRNALHGKFGEKAHRWEVVPELVHYDPWGVFSVTIDQPPGWEWRRAVGYQVQRLVKGERCPHTFVPVSAYTTSYCRERMRHFMKVAGSRNVYYLDADSLHVSRIGAELLAAAGEVSQNVPGKLRETGTTDRVRYFGCKNYLWGDQLICAGLPRKAVPLGNGRFRVEKFRRMERYISSAPPAGGIVSTEEMSLPLTSCGRDVQSNGWTTAFRADVTSAR